MRKPSSICCNAGNNAASSRIKTASGQFLETIVTGLRSRGAADDITSKVLERWSRSDTVKNAVVKRIVSNSFFTLSVGVINQRLFATIDKRHLTTLYAEMRSVAKKDLPFLPRITSSNAANMSKNMRKEIDLRTKKVRRKNSHCDNPDYQKDPSHAIPSNQGKGRRGGKSKNHVKEMGPEARDHHNYLVRRSMRWSIATTVLKKHHWFTTGTSQRTSLSAPRLCERRCDSSCSTQ